MSCDSFTSLQNKFVCAVKHRLLNKTFTEHGRSLIEAQSRALQGCSLAGEAVHCESNPTCESAN